MDTEILALLTKTVNQGPWVSFTPTIGGTGWALGNGSLNGYYLLLTPKTVVIYISFTIGSSTTIGSADLTFALPSGMTGANMEQDLILKYWSGSVLMVGFGDISGGGTTVVPYAPSSSSSSSLAGFATGGVSPSSGADIVIQGVIQIQ